METYDQAIARAQANANRDGQPCWVHYWAGRWYVGRSPVAGGTKVEAQSLQEGQE